MPSAAIESLRIAIANLQDGLARLLQEPNPSDLLGANDFSGLQIKLLCAAACLRGLPADCIPDAELEKAISEYRSVVEKLAQILPRVHGRLLTEKTRLEIAQAHVNATAAWAQASQKTL